MGFLDSVSNSLNRGVDAASRTASTAKLNLQMNDLLRQRQNLAAQLGASLYEQTRGDAAFTSGREALYDGIASLDEQRAALQSQISRLDEEGKAQTAAAQTLRCPKCGASVGVNDLFCSGCGLPIAEVRAGNGYVPPVTPAMGATSEQGDGQTNA